MAMLRKNMKPILILSLLVASAFSCRNKDISPESSCKLIQLSSGYDTSTFAYNEASQITKYSDAFMAGENKVQLDYNLSYNSAGKLENATSTSIFNGIANTGSTLQKFEYTNGFITGINYYESDNSAIINKISIKYDAKGRIVNIDSDDGDFQEKNTFEYDINGNYSKRTISRNILSADIKDQISIEEYTYDSNKNPESTLFKSIPFDLIYNHPWAVNGILTLKSTFIEKPGATPRILNMKRTDIKVDASGYIQELTLSNSEDFSQTQKLSYSLECK